MTKRAAAEKERQQWLGQQALFAVLCEGCPYAGCVGANPHDDDIDEEEPDS